MADDNLDSHLFPKDSPYNTREPYVPAYDFDVTHQIPAGGINYTNLTASSRAATAVISLSGEKGTFKDIQAAINYVNSLGGGRILVLPGTYTITQSIMLYGDIILEGLSTADCIFDFNSTTFNLSASSVSDITISRLTFKNCHNVLTGTIYLNTVTRADINHCAFEANTPGSGTGYDIYATLPRFVKVSFCLSTSSGGFYYSDNASRINEVSFNDIQSPTGYVFGAGTTGNGGGATIYSNNNAASPVKSAVNGRFVTGVFQNNTLNAGGSSLTETLFVVTSSNNLRLIGNFFVVGSSSAQIGLDITSSNYISLVGNYVEAALNSNPVALLTSCDTAFFNGNTIRAYASGSGIDGIKLVSTDNCVVTGNAVYGVGLGTSYGVNISNAACENTVVVGNTLFGITADTLDNGTGSVIANNS